MGNVKQTIKQIAAVLILVGSGVLPFAFSHLAGAVPTYSSNNYGVDEVFMGSGGANDMSSSSYQGRASLGDTGVGNASSSSYQVYGGFTTNTDPYIEMTAQSGTVDLGYLSESTTSTATGTFSVRTYLASGYNVIIASDPPKVTGVPGTHTLATNGVPTAPASPGTEQFGMNLVANTSPVSFGANPTQVPGPTYSYGQPDANYGTPNLYMFNKGDRVAYSTSSSGTTNYTISYIFNISSLTPAGDYVFHQILIATSTF